MKNKPSTAQLRRIAKNPPQPISDEDLRAIFFQEDDEALTAGSAVEIDYSAITAKPKDHLGSISDAMHQY